jgi:hypothetical protein
MVTPTKDRLRKHKEKLKAAGYSSLSLLLPPESRAKLEELQARSDEDLRAIVCRAIDILHRMTFALPTTKADLLEGSLQKTENITRIKSGSGAQGSSEPT